MNLINNLLYGAANNALLKRLPHVVAESGQRWALKSEDFLNDSEKITDVFANGYQSKNVAILKEQKTKKILSFKSDDGLTKFVTKGFFLTKWRHKLAFKKYAFNEALHLLQARNLGINTPDVYGVGFGFKKSIITWTVVILEYVPFASMRDTFIERKLSEEETWLYLKRMVPSLRKLYAAGCNHIDFGPHAIMMSPDDAYEDKIIDFQYASFGAKYCVNNLAFLLGYIGWSVSVNRKWVRSSMMNVWYEHVLESFGLPYTGDISKIIKQNESARRTIKERLKGYPENIICNFH